MILKIDPDFNNLIPPLMPDELKQLTQNILSINRCLDAVLIWNNTIIDGHCRYAICQEYSIPFEVSKMYFANKEDAKLWIIENQLGRRNLTDAARIELACRKVEMLRQKPRKNLAAADCDVQHGKNTADEPINVRKEIATAAGVGDQKVYRYMKIMGEGAPELIEQVKKGEMRIGTAYNQLRAETKTVRVFFDDADIRYRDSPFGRTNVLMYIDSIGKLYRFVIEAVLVAGEVRGMDGIVRRLEGQLRRLRDLGKAIKVG